MTDELQIVLEVGPKGKKVVAVAPDWPGLARSAKTGELALQRLLSYRPRYAPVAALAGMDEAFTAQTDARVVEEYPGTGSSDSGAFRSPIRRSTRRPCPRTIWNAS
jgi:hypothetical protein